MAKIYQFSTKEKTIRQMIHEGYITEKICVHLREAYERHELLYPYDKDTDFIRLMLSWRGQLSQKQKAQLETLLKYEIQEEEYPNGILDIALYSIDTEK